MSPNELLDQYFIETRHKLLDVAALVDRIERAGGSDDFRYRSLFAAIDVLQSSKSDRTEAILNLLSDPTSEPIDTAPGKGASGAWPNWKQEK